jgi:hypothetical protein
MGRDSERTANTRGGAPEALCNVLARSIALLVPRESADSSGAASRDAATSGDKENCRRVK